MSEELIDDGSIANPEQNPSMDVGPTSDKPTPTNVAVDLEADLNKIFGGPEKVGDGPVPPQGNIAPQGGPSTPSQAPRMSPEQYMKELKSTADKSAHRLEQLTQENTELTSVANFVHQLYEDPQVFNAFVAEINPDLVKPQNAEEYINSNLKKEFGADFVPDISEENLRGSRTWLYNKRADILYDESLQVAGKVPETITTLKEKRIVQKRELELQARQEKTGIIDDLKWSDTDYQGFLTWANKLSTKDFAKIYHVGKTQRQHSTTPSLASVPGGTPISNSAYEQELTNFFG
jgi:hypothetical protein